MRSRFCQTSTCGTAHMDAGSPTTAVGSRRSAGSCPATRKCKELVRSRLLLVHGTWQREAEVKNLIAGKLEDLTPMLGRLAQVALRGLACTR